MDIKVNYSLGSFGGYQAIKYDDELEYTLELLNQRKDGNAIGY